MAYRRGQPLGRALGAALALACAGGGPDAATLPTAPSLDPQRLARDVAWLADDARGGRAAGSPGAADAADYVAAGLRSAGFGPAGDPGSYLQRFEMPVSIRVERAALRVGDRRLERGREFEALLASGSGRVDAPLAFAGYGISAPELGYDDYAGLDVRDCAVLILEDRPGGGATPLTGPAGAGFLRRAEKIANARRRGASAVLLAPAAGDALGLAADAGHETALPTRGSVGILALGLSRAAADTLLSAAGGPDLAERQRGIDGSGRPAPERLPGVSVEADVAIARQRGEAFNVVGRLPGIDPRLAREYVVVGAHYDHLGLGEAGTLTPDRRGEVHNGADDNASGTAGLLELARAFGAQPRGRRSLILAAFTGEEMGLVGSREFVRSGEHAVGDAVAMINLDMIGRLRGGELTVFGTETSAALRTLVQAAREPWMRLILSDGGFAPSDQTSFYSRNVPVLFFFTGSHAEYHTPDDDAHRVDAEGAARVLRVVYRVTRALLDAPDRPQVTAAPQLTSPGRGGYGPYLGTVPDFAGSGDAGRGVLLQAVRPGSPAALAGLRAGDRIIRFDGASVHNLEEYAALLFGSRPGSRVEILVVRAGQRIATHPTLGQRR